MLKVVSLFSGGGLGDYGLELAGMEIVYQVEIDDYCQKILKLRWPKVPKWKDIKTLEADRLPQCAIIAGGFPCQDISVAGKGKGIKGERSGLWKEFYRIICEVKPRYVLVENVSALRSRGLTTVLSDLAEIGYDAEWHCIPASAVGAPHQRDRIWIVGYPNSMWKQQPKGSEQNQRRWFGNPGKDVADTNSQRLEIGQRKEDGCGSIWEEGETIDQSDWWAVEPNVGRVASRTPNRVDRLKLLGNGQVVQVVEWIGKRIIDHEFSHRSTTRKNTGSRQDAQKQR